MILGMSPLVFIHTLVSLVGIATGLVVAGFMAARRFHPAAAVHEEDDEDAAPA